MTIKKTPLFSAIATLALAGCGPGASTETEVPPDPVERRTYMLVGDESTEVQSPTLGDETCAAGTHAGGGGGGAGKVSMNTAALPPETFLRWAGRQMAGPSALEKPLRFAVTENGKVVCVAEAPSPSLQRLALQQGALAWQLNLGAPLQQSASAGGVNVAAGDINGDGGPQAALLVPAIQKVRAMPAPEAADTALGYALYEAGKVAPPAFDVALDAEAAAALFPAGSSSGTTELVLQLSSGGRTMGLLLPAVQKVRLAEDTARLSPQRDGVILLASDVPAVDPKVNVDRLRTEGLTSLSQTDVDLLLRAIDAQPAGVGDPVKDRAALLEYWNGVPGGPAGQLPAFKRGLSVFLTRSSDVEGLWAYQRLLAAGELFKRLEGAEGALPAGLSRAQVAGAAMVVTAALPRLETAAYPMLAAPLASVGASEGHSYALSLAAVGMMAEAAPLLLAALPAELASIDPDTLDAAAKSQAELEISVGQTDTAAHDYFLELGGVEGESTDEAAAQLEQLKVKSQALRGALVKLRDVTALRFAVTR